MLRRWLKKRRLLILAVAVWLVAGGLSIGEKSQSPLKVISIWGSVIEEGPGRFVLTPAPDPEDGIGSALALVEWPSQRAQLKATLLERIGGAEAWRGPWLLFGATLGQIHPCGYLRPDERGFVEFGRVLGPKPSDQRIIATVNGRTTIYPPIDTDDTNEKIEGTAYICTVSFDVDRVALDGREGHIGVFVIGQSSPYLGLYCEGSRVRFEIIT